MPEPADPVRVWRPRREPPLPLFAGLTPLERMAELGAWKYELKAYTAIENLERAAKGAIESYSRLPFGELRRRRYAEAWYRRIPLNYAAAMAPPNSEKWKRRWLEAMME